MGLTNRQVVAIVVTVPLSALFLYLLFKTQDEDDDFPENTSRSVASGQQTIIEIKVPYHSVAMIIGRNGDNIKKLAAETGARIQFNEKCSVEDEKTSDRVIKIRGKIDNVLLAERLIRKCVESAPIIKSIEIVIAQQHIGSIIGRNGANIRNLCQMSQAKIVITRNSERDRSGIRYCTISGTDEQIAFAKCLIDEEIQKEVEFIKRKKLASQDRRPRRTRVNSPAEEVDYKLDQPVKQPKSITSQALDSRLMPLPDHSDYFAIFVSAVEHPGHFWMQILGSPSKALDLDILMQSMTEYFSQDNDDEEAHRSNLIQTGDMVAAPFKHDSNWYRGKVLGFLDDGLVDIYYVDYGDNGSVHREDLKILRSDFLGLPHQATECCLANVQPLSDEYWSDSAIDAFEELTYCAQWKPLMAKVLSYKSTTNGTLPCLELVDTNKEEDILISMKMIETGFAIKEVNQVKEEDHSLFPSVDDAARKIQGTSQI